MSGSRKSLGIIQTANIERVSPSTEPVKPIMVRRDENSYPFSGKAKTQSNPPVIIYEDPPAAVVSKNDNGTQTEFTGCCSCRKSSESSSVDTSGKAQLDYKLLTQDEVPAEYWQILAERRRQALEDALEENKKIHSENEKLLAEVKELRVEVHQLQEDNVQLLELAGEAEYFANMLKKFTDEADSKNQEDVTQKKDMIVKEDDKDAASEVQKTSKDDAAVISEQK